MSGLLVRVMTALLVVVMVAGCGPRAEDAMLYLCDGSLSLEQAGASVRGALSARAGSDAAGVESHVAKARASLKAAEDRLGVVRSVAPADYRDWVDGLGTAIDATGDAIVAVVDGADPAVVEAALAAADAGRAAMGPATGCVVGSPRPSS